MIKLALLLSVFLTFTAKAEYHYHNVGTSYSHAGASLGPGSTYTNRAGQTILYGQPGFGQPNYRGYVAPYSAMPALSAPAPRTNYSGNNVNSGVSTNYGGNNVNHGPATNYGGRNVNLGPATNYGGRNFNHGPTTNYGGNNTNYNPYTTNRGGSNVRKY